MKCDPVSVRFQRYDGVYRYQKFFNRDAAAKRVAWWVIGDRYEMMYEYPKRFECECEDVDNGFAQYYSNDECLVHNREDGYFRRLHLRVYWWIKRGYMLPESGLAEF